MDDKFILVGLDDESSKHIAEVLRNKTCKKILDFLSERKEASEKDIADGMEMPINTVEYNIRKLLKSGLITKAKGHFWSVKGKKIPMYKLTRKHIIISPSKKPNLDYLKSIIPVVLLIGLFVAVLVGLANQNYIEDSGELKTFNSLEEIKSFIRDNSGGQVNIFSEVGVAEDFMKEGGGITAGGAMEQERSSAEDYSATNIQVEGVDEPDIVKNDGKYIYIVTGSKVVIIDAYPAEEIRILRELDFGEEYVGNIFVNENKLIVFTNHNEYVDTGIRCGEIFSFGVRCGGYSKEDVIVYIYEISDRSNPRLDDKIEVSGYYVDARMIGNYVYLISNKYIYSNYFEMPYYKVNGEETRVKATDVYYTNQRDDNYVFNTIAAVDIENGEFETETYLMGYSNSLYVSKDNIYLVYQRRLSQEYILGRYLEEVLLPVLPKDVAKEIKNVWEDEDRSDSEKEKKIGEIFSDFIERMDALEMYEFQNKLEEDALELFKEIEQEQQQTVIHRIELDGLDVMHEASGVVRGRVLNQFSMDEYKNTFRIATTTGGWDRDNKNNLYVLDMNLEIIGKIEGLAEGEQIYSARFIGERAYMVTFRQTDPLFVIGLSNPEAPEVLGELKVTGYSGYLHPYDESHLIGIGMEASEEGIVQGVKVSLFDVADVKNPREIDKYEITEGKWSSSEAVYDHRAVLFDKKKSLLVIPVSYNNGTITSGQSWSRYEYWQGVYVFDIELNGINLRGKVSHDEENVEDEYWYGGGEYVRRSLYMDDVLYTVSDRKVKANELESLEEIKEIELPFEEKYYIYRDSRP